MYVLNKVVGFLFSVSGIGAGLVLAGLALRRFGRRRAGNWVLGAGVAWFWIFSTGAVVDRAGWWFFEREFPPQRAEEAPEADAIVLLGGGIGAATNGCFHAELYNAADRTWHAARLWKAGKAKLVMPTGTGAEGAELPLLLDLGVPREAVVCEPDARNTEENAKFVERMLRERFGEAEGGRRRKVLLVTSSWHMRRSLLMYRKYAPGLEIVAAPADHEHTLHVEEGLKAKDFLPRSEALYRAGVLFKELVGYVGYRVLR